VSFYRQISRESAGINKGNSYEGPHESRFSQGNGINTFCTKYADPDQYPSFDKVMSRHQLNELDKKVKKVVYLQDYDPDFSKVLPNLSSGVPIFEK
jgi:hypothetical protein